MKLFDLDLNDSLLIVPSGIKDTIIKKISCLDKIYSYKIISDSELKANILFDYEEDAIIYIKNNYKVKIDIAKEYLENIYYIENENYKDNKLNLLKSIKNDLIEHDLIKKNKTFLSLIESRKVYVYGFDCITKELQILLRKLKDYTIVNEEYSSKERVVYKFDTIKEEVNYVFNEISLLLQKGIDINRIKIANASSDYEFLLKEYSNFYKIPIDFDNKSTLLSLIPVKNYLEQVKKDNNFDNLELLNELDEKLYNKVISLINKSNDDIEVLEYLFKNTTIPAKKYINSIELIDLNNNLFKSDDYIFVMSCNQTIYPRVYKDEELLNDKQKEMLGISTSIDKNKKEKDAFKILLNKDANIYLSYKLKSPFNNYVKAYILDDENIAEKSYECDNTVSFSKEKDSLELASIYDRIYKKEDNEYSSLLNNSIEIPYKKYSNKFISFDSNKIKDYITKNKINLSYSALDNFYKCPFKYYLNNVLYLGNKDTNHYADIGNVFHKVLQHSDDEGFDFDSYYDEQFEGITDKMTIFYIKKLKETLRNIIKVNNENRKYTSLANSLKEKEVNVIYNKEIKIKFRGFIDKLMYVVEDDKTYVAIIDYKTGNPIIDIDKVDFGLSLQVPIYLYLIKHTEEFKNVIVCGFYLQKLLLDTPKALDPNPMASIADSIKYQGYSNDAFSIISKFDNSYENSQTIKSLKLVSGQKWASYSKVISSEDMDKLANTIERKIEEAIDKICNCEFEITEKYLNGKSLSCDYCEFKNCCFKQPGDKVYLDSKKEGEDEDE